MERGMKNHEAILVIAALATLMTGCNGDGQTREQSVEKEAVTVAAKPVYFASESDVFHSSSRIESARKVSLAAFGSFAGTLPEATPTIDAAAAVINNHDLSQLKVSNFESGIIERTSFPFDYESDIPALKSLYALHKLDAVIDPAASELDQMAALARYTYQFLDGGAIPEDETPSGPSAFVITRNRLDRGIGGGSEVHAALFCQLALSCGYTARLVGMHVVDESGTPQTNDICEVYLTLPGKWVAFDPFHRATYYVRGTSPLSALELHHAAVEDRLREISPKPGVGDLADIVSVRENVLRRYHYIYLYRMNDILGRSPRNGTISWDTIYSSHLVWEDRNSLIADGKFDAVGRFPEGVKYATHARSDYEWNLNLISITVERKKDNAVTLYLDTVTPNFSRFDLVIGAKRIQCRNVYELTEFLDMVHIVAVNDFGKKGKPASVEFMR